MSLRFAKPTISSQQKMVNKKPTMKQGVPKQSPQFNWRVNEALGYFELGKPSRDDDLYIFNTTLISSEYFHLLGEPDRRGRCQLQGYYWTIQYNAFGCDIMSDPFQLSNEKESRRTFLGDKSTARIRSNGALFHEFLNTTSLEFIVFRAIGVNGIPGIIGISYADLKPLTSPGIKGIKATLEIIPQGSYDIAASDIQGAKPELRVIIELSIIPNFFNEGEQMTTNRDAMIIPSSPRVSLASPERISIGNDTDEPNDLSPMSLSRLSKLSEVLTHKSDNISEVRLSNSDNSLKSGEKIILEGTRSTLSMDPLEHGDNGNSQLSIHTIDLIHSRVEDETQKIEELKSVHFEDESVEKIQTATEVDNENLVSEDYVEIKSPKIVSPSVLDSIDGNITSRDRGGVIDKNLAYATINNQKTLTPPTSNNTWAKEELQKFRAELLEKERAYLQILSEEWAKRDSEREDKTSQVITEYTRLKEKLDTKEEELSNKENSFIKREREIDDFINKMTFEHKHRLEESKHRMSRMKEQHETDLDIMMTKLKASETEIRRLNTIILNIETKLRIKDEEIERLNAARSSWPEISVERRIMQLEEKNTALSDDLKRIRDERDRYQSETLSLARRQHFLQKERDSQLQCENEALRTQLFMNEQRKDLQKEQESLQHVSNQIENLKDIYSKRDFAYGTQSVNLVTDSAKSHRYKSPKMEKGTPKYTSPRQNKNILAYQKYLNPVSPSTLSPMQINSEIQRLVTERDRLMATGAIDGNDQIFRDIDLALTRLASDLVVRDRQ